MIGTIIFLLLIIAAAYVVYQASRNGWDWKKALAALLAVAAAIAAWGWEHVSSLVSGVTG